MLLLALLNLVGCISKFFEIGNYDRGYWRRFEPGSLFFFILQKNITGFGDCSGTSIDCNCALII
jgi:hypothetical protein